MVALHVCPLSVQIYPRTTNRSPENQDLNLNLRPLCVQIYVRKYFPPTTNRSPKNQHCYMYTFLCAKKKRYFVHRNPSLLFANMSDFGVFHKSLFLN